MKKLFCFLALSSLVLTSCSSSDDSSSSSASGLLKKTITTDEVGDVVTSNYFYSGNKIVKIEDSNGESIHFTYTGDLITKEDFYYDDNTLEQTNLYAYNASGQLTMFQRIEPDVDYGVKEVYVYNTDGTISVTNYYGNAASQTEFDGTGTIHFTNGEVSSIEIDGNGTLTFTYDDKNNPVKDITGLGKIWAFSDLAVAGYVHNLLHDSDGAVNTYTYNADGYPETSVENFFGDETTTEYFYN
jgi:uncharacterized protein YcfL